MKTVKSEKARICGAKQDKTGTEPFGACKPAADLYVSGTPAADAAGTNALIPDKEAPPARCLVVFQEERKNDCAGASHDHQALIDAGLTFLHQCSSPLGRLRRDQNGKPFLADHPEIHISISDSGDYTVCAFAPMPVGIDLQEIRSLYRTPLQLAKRFFTKEEYEMLRTVKTAEERSDLFCRLWTVKESCLKCTGQGLGGGLDSFRVDFAGGQVIPSRAHTSAHPYEGSFPPLFFTELGAPEGYHMTIAAAVRLRGENIQYLHADNIGRQGLRTSR